MVKHGGDSRELKDTGETLMNHYANRETMVQVGEKRSKCCSLSSQKQFGFNGFFQQGSNSHPVKGRD